MKRLLFLVFAVLSSVLIFAQSPVPFVNNEKQDLVRFVHDDKFGFKDMNGNIVIPAKYQGALDFSEGLALVIINYKVGFIDKNDNLVIPAKYKRAEDFSDGLAAVLIDDKWGFIDKNDNLIIPAKYRIVWNFSEGLAFVKTIDRGLYDDRGLYIDKQGNEYDTRAEGIKAVKLRQKELAKLDKLYLMKFEDYVASRLGSYDEYLRKSGKEPLTRETLAVQVEAEIEQWQKKDEFESTAKWQERVNENTRSAKAHEIADRITGEYNAAIKNIRDDYKSKYEQYAKEYCDRKGKDFAAQSMTLMPYDADNETFLIKTENMGDILLPVPAAGARAFKENWERIKGSAKAVYVPTGSDVALQSVRFGDYVYDSNTRADYALTDVNYNFNPVDLSAIDYNFTPLAATEPTTNLSVEPVSTTVTPRNVTPDTRTVSGGTLADVDSDIPRGSRNAENTFAVIIANENYSAVSDVQYAVNDGSSFAKYCNLTLGLPTHNIRTYTDATYGVFLRAVSDIQEVARAYDGDIDVIFFYAGHGMPDESTKEAYLLPIDGDGRHTEGCYPLSKLYSDLGKMGARSVSVFIDACFSGMDRDGSTLDKTRGIALVPKKADPRGNMVIFTAASDDQTALPYADKRHGLFTYYILKKLQESKGNLTLGELTEYVTDRVRKTSVTVNKKSQTPSVIVSPALQSSWRDIPISC